MYNKIMVPVDGSQLAECVLPHVEALAKGSQVKEIVFVRVVEPFRVPSFSPRFLIAETRPVVMGNTDSCRFWSAFGGRAVLPPGPRNRGRESLRNSLNF